MATKYAKLRGRIVEKYRNLSTFAREINTSPQTISSKLNGKVPITTRDVEKWIEPLDIKPEEIGLYFFGF